MADKVDGEDIKKTISDLQTANQHNEKLVSKINTKMCTRPPFRFLHDNILSILNHHNYHADLFEGPELDAKGMDKAGKVAFLGKIITVVAGDFSQLAELDAKPAKICAGKECEKTRAFIQYLCLAATGGAAGEDAGAAAEEAKEEAQEEAQEEAKEEPKEEAKEAAKEETKKEEAAPAAVAKEKAEDPTPAPAPAASGSGDFDFTLADVDTSAENLPRTKDMLSFVQKPKPTEKSLNRPPFRFLHDLIIAILTSKSYHANLYEGDELNAKALDKPGKVAFLKKMKITVAADMGIELDLNPSKICAGRECEKTRTFLQYLALAAHGIKGDGGAAPAAKPKPKDPKPAASEAKTEDPPPAASKETKSRGDGENMNVDDGSSWEKTAKMISAIIDKPSMKEKLLMRPPFRFLHDVMFGIMKETSFGGDTFSDEEKDAKAMSKPDRVKLLTKIFDMTKNALGIEIDVAATKVTAGKECAKTRVFLQYFCIAAKGGNVSDSAPTPAPQPKKAHRVKVAPAKVEPPEESKEDDIKLPEAPRTQLRPTTARRAPPKLANAAQKKDRKKEMVLDDVGTDGVILDGDEDTESEDDQDDIDEQSRRRSKRKKNKKENKNKRKGKLVSKIENELAKDKKDGDKEQKEEAEEEDSGIKLQSRIRRQAKDSVNVDGLRSQIQKLVQSTNPLAKCMDFVNDDIEAMNSEIEKWKSDFQKHSSVLEEEERKTEEQLAPLRAQITDVDKEVIVVLAKIQEAKARIAQNDVKITGMLRFVVNQK